MGNMCRPNIDFSPENVTSPVIHKDSMRALLANAVQLRRNLTHIDFKQAYLSADYDDREFGAIHIKVPEGYEGKFADSEFDSYAMMKGIYGFPSSGYFWHKRINQFLSDPEGFLKNTGCSEMEAKRASKFKFKQSKTDPCLYRWEQRDPKSGRLQEDF